MADQSFFEIAFEEAQNLLQTEADGFAAVLQSLAGFDIVSQAGDAISIFEGAGTALLTLFFCMEAFTYCANIDFHGGIEGAIRVAMKLVVSALIVQNVDNVVGIISGLFKSEVDFASAFGGIGAAFGDAMNQGTPLEGGLLEISVRDWGRGIDNIEQAMEPLFTTGGEDRSGMGFTIMSSFMDKLRVRSAPGKGTTVTMRRMICPRVGRK